MYYLFSILTGVLIAVMILANGELASGFGVYTSTAVIHLVGLIFIAIIYASKKRESQKNKKLPYYLYLGGVIGVLTIVFNNLAFGKISVSAILALGLLGQSITSIFIDQFGLFNMPKSNFTPQKLIGLLFVVLGIVVMVTIKEAREIGAISVALLTGLTVVMSRIVNAELAHKTNMMYSTLLNYITGFIVSAAIVLFAGRGEVFFTTLTLPSNILIYTGGIIGVFTIMLLNVTVKKISSFYLTMTLFVGQVFAGIIIDILLTNSFSINNLVGGILVAAGLTLNVWFEKNKVSKNKIAIESAAS